MNCVHVVLIATLMPLALRVAAAEVQKQVGLDKLSKLPKDSLTYNTVVSFASVKLPEGKLMKLVEDDDIDNDNNDKKKNHHLRHHNSQREMRLNAIDPSGLIVKFEDCTNNGDNVLVEVCLDYNDGVFGEACDTYVVEDYHTWVKFKNDYIFQKMLTDFCHVCHEECDSIDRWSSSMNHPSICNIKHWAGGDVYCTTLCDNETSLPTQDALVANCYGSSTWRSDYYFKVDCATQKHDRETGNSYYNPDDWNDRNRDLEVNLDYEFQTVDGEDCFLSDWWDMWIQSCDQAGYPGYDNDVAYPMGNAYLHCSLEENDENGEDIGGKDTLGLCKNFYNSLKLCHRASNTYQRWWGPESEINMASNEACEPLQQQEYGEEENGVPSRDESEINGIVVTEDVTATNAPPTNSSAKEPNNLDMREITTVKTPVQDDKPYCFVIFLVGFIIGGLVLRGTQCIIRYVVGRQDPSSSSSPLSHKEAGEDVTTVMSLDNVETTK